MKTPKNEKTGKKNICSTPLSGLGPESDNETASSRDAVRTCVIMALQALAAMRYHLRRYRERGYTCDIEQAAYSRAVAVYWIRVGREYCSRVDVL